VGRAAHGECGSRWQAAPPLYCRQQQLICWFILGSCPLPVSVGSKAASTHPPLHGTVPVYYHRTREEGLGLMPCWRAWFAACLWHRGPGLACDYLCRTASAESTRAGTSRWGTRGTSDPRAWCGAAGSSCWAGGATRLTLMSTERALQLVWGGACRADLHCDMRQLQANRLAGSPGS